MKKYVHTLFRVKTRADFFGMNRLKIDNESVSKCSPSNRDMGIGNYFHNFECCTEWDEFPQLNGMFVTNKRTDPVSQEIQRIQLKYGFSPGEPLTRFNTGRIVSSMQGYYFQKFFLPYKYGTPSNTKGTSPGFNLKRRGSDIASVRIKKSSSLRNVDFTSLKIGLKLSSPKRNDCATKFDEGNLSNSLNGDITSLEIGLKLSRNGKVPVDKKINVSITDDEDEDIRTSWKPKRNRSFPYRRESFGGRTFSERQYDCNES